VYGQLKKKLETLEMVELRLKESEERNAALSEDVGKLEKEAAEVSVLRTQLKMAEMRNSMITKELEQTQAERDQLRSAAVPASPVQSRHRRTPSSVSVASNSSGSAPAGHSRVVRFIFGCDLFFFLGGNTHFFLIAIHDRRGRRGQRCSCSIVQGRKFKETSTFFF